MQAADFVIVMMKDMPQSHWPMGRILERYGGSNDVVLIVKMNRASGKMIRPAFKIPLLVLLIQEIVDNLDWLFIFICSLGREDFTSSRTVTLRI